MKKGYLLNRRVRFYPDENKLSACSQSDNIITLTSPAARCFEILIERAPDIVTHNELLKLVWEDNGIYVPPNTLYQSISLIRRGIKAISSGDPDLIKTVPRQGFQLKEGTLIEELTPETEVSLLALKTATERNDPEQPEQVATPVGEDNYHEKTYIKKSAILRIPKIISTIIMVLAFIVGVSVTKYFKEQYIGVDFFKDYTFKNAVNGCQFYVNPYILPGSGKFTVPESELQCKNYPWVYITSYANAPILSAISCDEPANSRKKPKCVSLLFRGVTIQ